MSELIEEVRQWNSPTVGAFLLYKFTKGYVQYHTLGEAPIAILHFVASAILTSESLKAPISNMRANLQSYVRSFEDNRNTDVFLELQERTKDRLAYTWASIDLAVAGGLLFWDADEAKLYVKPGEPDIRYGHSPKPELKKDGEKAEILGQWFAEHDVPSILSYLKILL